MSWLNVGKSFNANASALVPMEQGVAVSDYDNKTIPEKDFSSSDSEDAGSNKCSRINNEPVLKVPRRTIDVSWRQDRRGDTDNFMFSSKLYECNLSSRKKRSHDILEEPLSQEVNNVIRIDSPGETHIKSLRYFSRSNRNTLRNLTLKRRKLFSKNLLSSRVEILTSPSFLVLPPLDFSDSILDENWTSEQSIILNKYKVWSRFILDIEKRILSDFSQISSAITAYAAVQTMLTVLFRLSSGEWEFYPSAIVLKSATINSFHFESQTIEKNVFFLEELLRSIATSDSEILRDSISSSICVAKLRFQQSILSSFELETQLEIALNDFPESEELFSFARTRLRTMYPSSSFLRIRDYENSYWSELLTKLKNKAAARRLMISLGSSGKTAVENFDEEETFLRSEDMLLRRVSDVGYYIHLLDLMGYQEHSSALFQALITVHLRELESSNAVFLVREVLQQWEGEIEPRLGEMLYSTQRGWNDMCPESTPLQCCGKFSILQDVFPSLNEWKTKNDVVQGPSLPPPQNLEKSRFSNNSKDSKANDESINSKDASNLEVVNGKVLVYSRLHGYKIWIPVDSALEDTSEIYKRVLADVDDILVQETSSTNRIQKERCKSISDATFISRLVYDYGNNESNPTNYVQFVYNDHCLSLNQFSSLRALGVSSPNNEDRALKEMEEAETFPEKVVFSDDLKPFLFWIRDFPGSLVPSVPRHLYFTAGIRSIPYFLIQLGPVALGLHFLHSIHYDSIETNYLKLSASIITHSTPTFGIVRELLMYSNPKLRPMTRSQVLDGCLKLLGATHKSVSPVFVNEQLIASHLTWMTSDSASRSETGSRLIFVTRTMCQIVEHFKAFQFSNEGMWSEPERNWMKSLVSQLRQCVMSLIFLRYSAEIKYFNSDKSLSPSDISQKFETCRTQCRSILEASVDTSRDCNNGPICHAGDLQLWAQYLYIERELLTIHQLITPEEIVSLAPIWKMADKVVRIIDAQRQEQRLAERGSLGIFFQEVSLYCAIAMLLLQEASALSTSDNQSQERSMKYQRVCRSFLIQRATAMFHPSTGINNSPLKSLYAMESASKKKNCKSEDLFTPENPMLLQEALNLWQVHATNELNKAIPKCDLLMDIPDARYSWNCWALLDQLSTIADAESNATNPSIFNVSIDSIQQLLAVVPPTDRQYSVLQLLCRELMVMRIQHQLTFATLNNLPSTSISAFCDMAMDALKTYSQESRLLGCWIFLQYFGRGFGLDTHCHRGYRTIRQYWRYQHAKRSLQFVTDDKKVLHEYLQFVGSNGEHLSLRERCFEIAVEFLRHNHVLYQYASVPSETRSLRSNLLLPDWKNFFSLLVPQYRVMYEYHSFDEIITGDLSKLCLPDIMDSYRRICAVFEQILSCPSTHHVPWLWRLYLHTVLSVGDVTVARNIALRALAKCGYCKALFVDLLGALSAVPAIDEVSEADKKQIEDNRIAFVRMMESQGMFLRR